MYNGTSKALFIEVGILNGFVSTGIPPHHNGQGKIPQFWRYENIFQ
jgi:hypothetical protein